MVRWNLPWGLLACLLLSVATLVTCEASNAGTRLFFSQPSGSITSGSVLGISVGSRVDVAVEKMRRMGIYPPTYFPGGRPLYPDGYVRVGPLGDQVVSISEDQTIISFRDDSWRNGVIDLTEEDGVIVRISWRYEGPFFVDI